jgi:hypothetical protein
VFLFDPGAQNASTTAAPAAAAATLNISPMTTIASPAEPGEADVVAAAGELVVLAALVADISEDVTVTALSEVAEVPDDAAADAVPVVPLPMPGNRLALHVAGTVATKAANWSAGQVLTHVMKGPAYM